jgi:carboxyl-terminal processing protease
LITWRRERGVSERIALARVCVMSCVGILLLSSCVAPHSNKRLGGLGKNLDFDGLEQSLPRLAEVRSSLASLSDHPDDIDLIAEQLNLFAEVFQVTRQNYISSLSADHLIDDFVDGVAPRPDFKHPHKNIPKRVDKALKHMLRSLDPHSDYLTSRDFDLIQSRTRGEFTGIGIEMTMEAGYVKCVAVLPGTPASRSAIRPGDVITNIDGAPVKGASLIEAVDRIRGLAGTVVTLDLARYEISDTFEVKIVREKVKVESVESWMDGNIGYIRISTFNETTGESLREAVSELAAGHPEELGGLVIDLRNNPGGLLEQALQVTNSFLVSGEIVSTAGRRNKKIRKFQADSEDISMGVPLAVLINNGTASASEIVSGALKDRGRALIFGRRSFGKGSVQSIIPLSRMRGALRLTTARYYLPSGRSIQVHGVEPHVVGGADSASSIEADLANFLQPDKEQISSRTVALNDICPESSKENDPVLSCAFFALRSHLLPPISAQLQN